jgi:hypothetical protein
MRTPATRVDGYRWELHTNIAYTQSTAGSDQGPLGPSAPALARERRSPGWARGGAGARCRGARRSRRCAACEGQRGRVRRGGVGRFARAGHDAVTHGYAAGSWSAAGGRPKPAVGKWRGKQGDGCWEQRDEGRGQWEREWHGREQEGCRGRGRERSWKQRVITHQAIPVTINVASRNSLEIIHEKILYAPPWRVNTLGKAVKKPIPICNFVPIRLALIFGATDR